MAPITLLTSTSLEKKLYSKERKFGYSILRYIVQTIGLAMLMFLINMAFFKSKDNYSGTVATVGFVLLSLVYCWVAWSKEIKATTLFHMKYSRRTKMIMYIVLLIFQAQFIIMPAYIIGSLVSYPLFQKGVSNQVWLAHLAVLIISYIIFAAIMLPLMRTVWAFLDLKSLSPNYMEDNSFYIEMEKKRWYIHHFTDKNKIMLGDAEQLSECSRFKIIDREIILQEEIHMVRPSSQAEVEYVI